MDPEQLALMFTPMGGGGGGRGLDGSRSTPALEGVRSHRLGFDPHRKSNFVVPLRQKRESTPNSGLAPGATSRRTVGIVALRTSVPALNSFADETPRAPARPFIDLSDVA